MGATAVLRDRNIRRLQLMAGATLIAALVVVNTVALIHLHNRPPRARPPTDVVPAAAATPAEISAAAAWAGRELSRAAKIIADPTMRAVLTAHRFIHVQTPPATATGAASQAALPFDYVISTTALRTMAGSGNPADRALHSSLPIAVFGSGVHEVVVRQVTTTTAADIAARRSVDLQTRRTGERQLLTNPAVHTSGAARAALQAGQLDLRAATVLALMANSSHVDLISVNADGPEQAAGLPARSVDVRTDAADAVDAMLSNLPPSYRPGSDTRLPDGTHRLVWPIDPEPPTGLK